MSTNNVSKTSLILELNARNLTVSEIVKCMKTEHDIEIKYQHVYNTLKMKQQTVKKATIDENAVSKSSEIRRLHKEGYTNSEISKELDISYQFVYNVVSRIK